jgi:hypothetical protein
MNPKQEQFSADRAASKSIFLSLPVLGLSTIVLLALAGHANSQTLFPTEYRVNNISVAGPSVLVDGAGWQTYKVSYHIQRLNGFTGPINLIVWLMDRDSREAGRDGDDFLSFKRIRVEANQTDRTTWLKLKGHEMKVWGTAVQDPAGNSNDRDSGEGGPSWFGPNPAEIYANISNFTSAVTNVTVQH